MKKISSQLRSALRVIAIAGGSTCALGACGKGPDLGGGSVQVVQAVPIEQSCFGCNYVSDVAIGSSGIYAALALGAQGGSGGSGALASLDFPTNSAPRSAWTSGAQDGSGLGASGFDIAASGDGKIFWAIVPGQQVQTDAGGGGGPTGVFLPELFTASEDGFLSAAPTSGIFLPRIVTSGGGASNTPQVVGLVADADAAYVAYAQPSTGGGFQQAPDAPGFPGATPAGDPWSGAIARVAHDGSTESVTGFTFMPSFAVHVLAQNKDTLYWPDYGSTTVPGSSPTLSIRTEPKASFGATPTSFTAIQNVPSQPSLTIMGIAANDQALAWIASQQPGNGSMEPGCQIWARTSTGTTTKLYDSFSSGTTPLISCYGAAVDDTYAYVAVVSQVSGNNGQQGQTLVGKGVARVPLAGGPLQIASLQSNRWYGPRRVLVDATYVYAIDPSFVVRFPKNDFR